MNASDQPRDKQSACLQRLVGPDVADFVRHVCTYLGAPENADMQEVALRVSRETSDPRWGAVLVMRRIEPGDRWKEIAHSLGFHA